MKAAVYHSRDQIRVEEMPVPKIGPGELLVEVKACGLCGSDLMAWYAEEKAPAVLGHEPTGIVAAVGEGVERFAIGNRVFVHHHVPCFTCHYCVRGFYTQCATFKATHLDPGGFAEFVRVPALNVQRDVLALPDDVSFDVGTLIEPVATCIRGVERSGLQKGDTVAVLGAGMSGLVLLQLARLWGAAKIVISDFVEYRRQIARYLGADHTVDAAQDVGAVLRDVNEGRGADVVLVSVGSLAAMEQGLALAERGGTVLCFAPTRPGVTMPVSPHRLMFEEVTITGSYSCTPQETRLSLKLIQGGRINVSDLITHHFDLAGLSDAFQLAAQAQESLKIIIRP